MSSKSLCPMIARAFRRSLSMDSSITCDGTVESVAVRRGPGDVLLLDYGPESFYNSVSRVFYGVRHDR